MERKKHTDFPPEVMQLFNRYVHGGITRRDFLEGAAKFTVVGGMSAATMFELLKPNYAWAQQVPKDDSRIRVSYETYPSPKGSGTMRGYLARPANASGKLPAVVVIHENRGLNPYTEDVARRLAVANFVAFAPDALTPVGGYPGDEEKAAALFRGLDNAKRTEDLIAAAGFVKARPESSGKYGATGFCFGGGIVNVMATRLPDMGAGAPFYGAAPAAADVPNIKARLLQHYAENDDFINKGRVGFEEAMRAANVTYESHVYPGTMHGFHNDTTPRYVEAAAKLAWQRTVDFFNRTLRG